MAFNIDNLGSYVQNGSGYAMKSIFEAPTAKALIGSRNVQFGVKGTAAILKMNSDITLVDASSCSRTASSTTNLSNKNLVVKPIASFENLCPKTLWNTFYAESLAQGQAPEESFLPAFADAMMTEKAMKIAEVNETMLWQGDTSLTGSTNNKRIDGIIKQVTATTSVTGATVVAKLQNFFLACDATVRNQSDFVIAISQELYDQYLVALAQANIFKPVEDKTLFGTSAKLHVTGGLNGATYNAVGIRLSNMQLGMDGQSDADAATVRYSIETTNWYVDFQYALGVAVVFADEAKKATI